MSFQVRWGKRQSLKEHCRPPTQKLECLRYVSFLLCLSSEKLWARYFLLISVSCASFCLRYYKFSDGARSCWVLFCSLWSPGIHSMPVLLELRVKQDRNQSLGLPPKKPELRTYVPVYLFSSKNEAKIKDGHCLPNTNCTSLGERLMQLK